MIYLRRIQLWRINLANLVLGDAIQVFNHKDVSGPLQHLKLIGIQTHSKGVPNSNNPNFGVVPTSAIQKMHYQAVVPNTYEILLSIR